MAVAFLAPSSLVNTVGLSSGEKFTHLAGQLNSILNGDTAAAAAEGGDGHGGGGCGSPRHLVHLPNPVTLAVCNA